MTGGIAFDGCRPGDLGAAVALQSGFCARHVGFGLTAYPRQQR